MTGSASSERERYGRESIPLANRPFLGTHPARTSPIRGSVEVNVGSHRARIIGKARMAPAPIRIKKITWRDPGPCRR